jgi:hypothetical protein
LERLLARLAEQARRGTLVVAPWREVGDRLLALDEVVVRYDADGGAVVENRGAHAVPGLSLSASAADLVLDVDGAPVLGRRTDADRTTVWFDLPAGAHVTVRGRRGAAPVPFLPIGDVVGDAR